MMDQNLRLKLSICTDPVLVEPISDFLLGVTESAVEIDVADQDGRQYLNAYLAEADMEEGRRRQIILQIGAYLSELAKIFKVSEPSLAVSEYAEEDWGSNWKKHFIPFAIVPGLVIAPTWERYQAAPGEQVIVMDPGMAFGTGHHATTSLCLALVREVVERGGGSRVLDVGTGTGILGMAAALYGATRVLAIDNDPLAVAAASENVARNDLATVMEVSAAALEKVAGGYTLVVANIIHDTLLEMAGALARLVEEGGALVLSGILQGEQTENIVHCFSGLGFEPVRIDRLAEWSALLLRKGKG
ncbi:50S ribosomal protein L11 methyltransferase [Desulfoprunum benzoelyticum]|uniref:Ribosomal protein L11 methyltransferase n=1 Tax=Desulfoprunum benzoelyticum TaxID=1506996 RepID=A0A840V6I9_9BACT|nr:50S ribosomal protein L11 methyltransferase [Desulfoprunum benzoelyticum]MBB5348641.1 ribosomal protein L11 methyltransferase [Desulfoprunum benzoelyticum]MBM9529894.1 50S ribosomal protein L11 methyltransferase [Desulfoprunum benzoelyticum]